MQASQVIYACYGNSSVTTDQSNPTSTWNSNYTAVWHLDEATGANNDDSTINGNTATPIDSPVQTAGLIDGALNFAGSNQYTSASGADLNILGALTYSGWINPSGFSNYPTIMEKGDAYGSSNATWLGFNNTDGTDLEFTIYDTNISNYISRYYSGALSTGN
jgi:hypothetical protein